MTETTKHESVEKIAELIKDIRIAMLVTVDQRRGARSRPMATQDVPFDGTLWFFTSKDSAQAEEIARDPRVNVAYSSPASEDYISLSGAAAVVDDRARMHELWSAWVRPWFDGPDDPDLRLIRVDVEEAEYWSTRGGKVASFVALVKGVITGNAGDQNNEHARVEL